MSDSQFESDEMEEFLERMTETYVTALNRNLDAQAEFVDAWIDSIDDSVTEDRVEEGYEGSVRAYEAWMDAAETSFERMGDALEGEEVDPDEFRDTWLRAANEAFKETMSTTAFAAATGESVDQLLELQRQVDEAGEETLHAFGFATLGDVQEVGERLVEAERRLHAVEEKLDRVLDELE